MHNYIFERGRMIKAEKKVDRYMEATKKPAKKSMPKPPLQNRQKMVQDDGF